jgi:hypothetical protein
LWLSAGFRRKGLEFAVFQHIHNFGIGIIQVTEIHTLGRAYAYTSRIFSLTDTMNTECAFINITVRVRIAGFIRAGLNAGPTTNTFMVGYKDDTSVFDVACTGGATSHTR